MIALATPHDPSPRRPINYSSVAPERRRSAEKLQATCKAVNKRFDDHVCIFSPYPNDVKELRKVADSCSKAMKRLWKIVEGQERFTNKNKRRPWNQELEGCWVKFREDFKATQEEVLKLRSETSKLLNALVHKAKHKEARRADRAAREAEAGVADRLEEIDRQRDAEAASKAGGKAKPAAADQGIHPEARKILEDSPVGQEFVAAYERVVKAAAEQTAGGKGGGVNGTPIPPAGKCCPAKCGKPVEFDPSKPIEFSFTATIDPANAPASPLSDENLLRERADICKDLWLSHDERFEEACDALAAAARFPLSDEAQQWAVKAAELWESSHASLLRMEERFRKSLEKCAAKVQRRLNGGRSAA